MTVRRKLIEVALPLEAINKHSAKEKSVRQGHPSSMHHWWARRPLATARAVLFAQLVDDPSSRAQEFRDEALRQGEPEVEMYVDRCVDAERERLFDLITRMVDWDNLDDRALFAEVRAEILRSTDGMPPSIVDPFAGGGAIPLEAQRLGLEAHASDLNPVAVLINKSLVEIPPRFAGRSPVFPDASAQKLGPWTNVSGLAEDVRRYGQWMLEEAERRLGHLYPKAILQDGSSAPVIAWIWARTVICPNPACGIETPLVRSWWLGKKKGKEAYVVPEVVDGLVHYSIGHDPTGGPTKSDDGTVGRTGAICVSCGTAVPLSHIRHEGQASGLGRHLLAVVAEGQRRRWFLSPSEQDVKTAHVDSPADVPVGKLGHYPRDIKAPIYGLDEFQKLFTPRQLVAMTTFSDLVGEARSLVLRDSLVGGAEEGERLEEGGSGGAAYADAVATYLAMTVDKLADLCNSLVRWEPMAECPRQLFGRQAIPMVWDYAEANPLSSSSGSFFTLLAGVTKTFTSPAFNFADVEAGVVEQADAASRSFENLLISTDPPYYDNIGYSDLSDFFYVWMRRTLREIYPALTRTILVPKAGELVANPHRHDGPDGAQRFFESGFEQVFSNARSSASSEYPITVYYAFKQAESDGQGESSTGWETILRGMVHAGWVITATWPMRTETAGRMVAQNSNALASSIVIALRPRSADAPIIDRRGFIAELKATLPDSLRDLQRGAIAPVDLAQAAIGPGMAIFSKYQRVVQPAGGEMSVREALQQINVVLDEVLSLQEGDFDRETRWCVAWFEAHEFEAGAFGEAETLANAKGASVGSLARSGVLSSGAGKVRLFAPSDLPSDYDPMTDDHVSLWEITLQMARALGDQGGGLADAGRILNRAEERGVDMAPAHELAYRLFAMTEKKGLVKPGILFNALGSSWPELRAAAKSSKEEAPERSVSGTLDFESLSEK